MEAQALRPISKAVAAASTAGAIATACWLLHRILDDDDEVTCSNVATSYLTVKAATTYDDNDTRTDCQQQQQQEEEACNADDGFALLPVVSESDDEVDKDAMDCYTGDYFTPPYDVCILSVSVETRVDSLANVSSNNSNACRLCRAAVESWDSIGDGTQLDEKIRTLSFSTIETSSNDSMLSISSQCGEEEELECPRTCSRTQQRLYVRL